MTLTFPPFTPAGIWLLGINTAVFLLLSAFGTRAVIDWVYANLGLVPSTVVSLHFAIWQIVTYSFIHVTFWHWFGNMLGIWMFGSTFESSWGTRRFLELFFTGVVGAALTTIVLSFAHILIKPDIPTVGASGGVFAILMAFGLVFGENEIMMIPFPFLIKAKYFVLILIVVTVAFAIGDRGGGGYLAPFWGLLFWCFFFEFFSSRGVLGKVFFFGGWDGVCKFFFPWERRAAAEEC